MCEVSDVELDQLVENYKCNFGQGSISIFRIFWELVQVIRWCWFESPSTLNARTALYYPELRQDHDLLIREILERYKVDVLVDRVRLRNSRLKSPKIVLQGLPLFWRMRTRRLSILGFIHLCLALQAGMQRAEVFGSSKKLTRIYTLTTQADMGVYLWAAINGIEIYVVQHGNISDKQERQSNEILFSRYVIWSEWYLVRVQARINNLRDRVVIDGGFLDAPIDRALCKPRQGFILYLHSCDGIAGSERYAEEECAFRRLVEMRQQYSRQIVIRLHPAAKRLANDYKKRYPSLIFSKGSSLDHDLNNAAFALTIASTACIRSLQLSIPVYRLEISPQANDHTFLPVYTEMCDHCAYQFSEVFERYAGKRLL